MYQKVLIQWSTRSFNGKERGTMFMTAFRIPTKKQDLDSQVKPRLRSARIISKLVINRLLKVFGKTATIKMKILMTFHKQMPLHIMLPSQCSNIKDLKLLKTMILTISLPQNIGKTTIYTMGKTSWKAAT